MLNSSSASVVRYATIVVLSSLLSVGVAKAEPGETRSKASRFDLSQLPEGTRAIMGLEAGTIDYSKRRSSFREGTQAGVTGGLSYYSPRTSWVTDAELGLNRSFQKSEGKDFNSLSLEVAPQYRFAPNWMAGPRINGYLGNGREFGDAGNTITSFVGAGVARDFSTDSDRFYRLGLKLMTDINISNQAANLAMLSLKAGIGSQTATKVSQTRVHPKVAAQPQTRRLTINAFELGKADLSSQNRSKLQALTSDLKSQTFKSVTLRGHADVSGNDTINEKVSLARALEVKRLLVETGVEESRIKVEAKSATSPVSANGLSAIDRRVEVVVE